MTRAKFGIDVQLVEEMPSLEGESPYTGMTVYPELEWEAYPVETTTILVTPKSSPDVMAHEVGHAMSGHRFRRDPTIGGTIQRELEAGLWAWRKTGNLLYIRDAFRSAATAFSESLTQEEFRKIGGLRGLARWIVKVYQKMVKFPDKEARRLRHILYAYLKEYSKRGEL